MKKLFTLFFILISFQGYSQCSETPVTRVLLVGDSWANMIGIDNAIKNAFERFGHSNYTFYTNAVLAENGTKTSDFLQPNRLNEIQTQLLAHPDIDFVHLSLGGNDVLNNWHKSWSQARTDSLLDSVYSRLTQIISFIQNVKPGIRVFWSGYCYPNFAEIINDMAPFQNLHPFYGTWNGMGQPTFLELNTLLNYFSNAIDTLVSNDPSVGFVRGTGLMQYIYGQTSNLGVPPGGTYPPLTAPMPEGFPNYPSPRTCMRSYVIATDCFHLKPEAFNHFLDFHTRKYYQKQLMDDQYILSSGGTMDGSVSDLGNVSTDIKVGNSGGEDFAAVLTFNTTLMPDTGVSKASIFLRREALSGTNPVSSNMQVKVISGNFGATVDVEASDFNATFDAMDTPCQFGSSAANGHWIRLELPSSILPFITDDFITQFMITAPGTSGVVTFSNATDPENAPVLNITYGPEPLNVMENVLSENSLLVFPNPAKDFIRIAIRENKPVMVELTDVSGRLVMQTTTDKLIDISNFQPGVYVIKVYSEKRTATGKVIKQ
ncbi:MAG: T9SS type A sorting domain-containing protein [Bacteroidia bacterium]|nr:T9SS type A sorting domain-containing protein [Bacteroidia bacterium]